MNSHEKVQQLIRMKDQVPLSIDGPRTALLLIDLQRNFTDRGAAFGQALERVVPGVTDEYFARVEGTVLPNVQRLLEAFRARKLPVIFTGTGTCTGSGGDLPGWLQSFDSLGRMVLGRPVWPPVGQGDWTIDQRVAPQTGELVVNKTASGAFAAVDSTLRNLGVNSVVIGGLSSDVCVGTTAREAADRGYQVIVAEDACATLSEQMHQGSMDAVALAFGRVRTTQQVIELLHNAKLQVAKGA